MPPKHNLKLKITDIMSRYRVRAALREMATKYPYDAIEKKDIGGITLSSHQITSLVNSKIRLSRDCIVQVLKYSRPESPILLTLPKLLRQCCVVQQASAVVAARREIVDGAVGMVELALEQLSVKGIIELDEDKKATMVSNLLVVLCSEDKHHSCGEYYRTLYQ